MKVVVVFGTRPEAIKMCPVIKELRCRSGIKTIVCLTGQHKEMLDQVMDIFKIKADYNLNVMSENQSLSMITSRVLLGLDDIFDKEKPDYVLVHGDTTSSFAAALAAFYCHIPVGHVEAGLRTYNMQSPFPEEFNRQSVDLIADLFFAPTELARQQLLSEGKRDDCIFVTGNTVIDALQTTIADDYSSELLEWVGESKLILLTAHRRENIGLPMKQMFAAVKKIIDVYSNVKIIYPIHRNPKVRELAEHAFADCDRIRLIEPLDVINFHNLMKRCYLVLTDSGGIQEEAPSLGKPVLVMRDTTERPEGVKAGTLKLIGTNEDNIYMETERLLTDLSQYQHMCNAQNPYGDGKASERIVNIMEKHFKE